jgi:hypothetical protein
MKHKKSKPRVVWKRRAPSEPHTLDRLHRAITLNRSHDYLNPGFGQHNRPEWMKSEILVVMVAQ